MHVVMHSDSFQSIGSAKNSSNGLAVLAFFIDVSDNKMYYRTQSFVIPQETLK